MDPPQWIYPNDKDLVRSIPMPILRASGRRNSYLWIWKVLPVFQKFVEMVQKVLPVSSKGFLVDFDRFLLIFKETICDRNPRNLQIWQTPTSSFFARRAFCVGDLQNWWCSSVCLMSDVWCPSRSSRWFIIQSSAYNRRWLVIIIRLSHSN